MISLLKNRKITYTLLVCLLSLKAFSQTNTFPPSGNVGIGTSAPTMKLDIVGWMKLGDTQSFNYFGQDAAGGFIEQVGSTSATSKLRIQTSKNGDGSNYAYISIDPMNGISFNHLGNGNSNVGIGTATPNEKLSVNGKIRAHEIKVETANWPDYVFEDDYKIASLTELEKYIKENKHLPEMPSAKVVEANGVELGEMNKLLLKKVEELTLHLIKLNERIEELEKNNQKAKTN
ncbi:hypothetical protein FA048_18685 [Pedobacter polaris]|uniref:Peptidase S74 domain-containing protein n=1 Tax=Pedobacter polaris TaxID=2571273 RepID=A0A4U1CEC3_9SPHI|nr:hypothetical protein [Pedobacter polaris]TKC04715.1 hypothetical protein FA048_18685 [Pedobacter polaris]